MDAHLDHRAVPRDAAAAPTKVVYVAVEVPLGSWVKVGRSARGVAERFRGGASTDNPRPLEVHRAFEAPDPAGVEQRAHAILDGQKIRRASGGSEWFECDPDTAARAVEQALQGTGRVIVERWRLIGEMPQRASQPGYSQFRWRVAWIDRAGVIIDSKRKGSPPAPAAPTHEGAKAHLERLPLQEGMLAAVLWDRETGRCVRYELSAAERTS